MLQTGQLAENATGRRDQEKPPPWDGPGCSAPLPQHHSAQWHTDPARAEERGSEPRARAEIPLGSRWSGCGRR